MQAWVLSDTLFPASLDSAKPLVLDWKPFGSELRRNGSKVHTRRAQPIQARNLQPDPASDR